MVLTEAAIALMHGRVAQMHRLTRRLVETNSYSKNVEGVNAVGELLRQAFGELGLDLRVIKGGTGFGDHYVWSTQCAGEQPPILLIGHHDTVFPPGHFEGWREEGTLAYGPGCLDMKGGLALIWGVMSALAAQRLIDECPLVIVSVADEEIGSIDSKPHLEALAEKASCALVFEAGRTGDRIVTRRRGTGGVRAIATGVAAHAGNAHHLGKNAIWSLARFIDFAQGRTNYERGLTVSVGLISGGTSANTVPDGAEAMLDVRFDTVADAHHLMGDLERAANDLAIEGTKIRLEGGIKRLPMQKTSASEALYREYADAQRAAGLGSEEHPLVGGGSDANTVAGVGLAAIDGLGPRGAGFHTTDEHIDLNSFGPKAEALLRFLCTRLGDAGAASLSRELKPAQT